MSRYKYLVPVYNLSAKLQSIRSEGGPRLAEYWPIKVSVDVHEVKVVVCPLACRSRTLI